MSTDDYINDVVKAGISAFIKSGIGEGSSDEDESPKNKKDDIKTLPENEEPESGMPDTLADVPESAPEENLEKKYLGTSIADATDEQLISFVTKIAAALGIEG